MPTVTPRTDLVPIAPVMGRWHRVRFWVATAAIGLAVLAPLFYMVAALGTRVGLWGVGTGLGTLSRDIGPKLLMAAIAVGLAALLLGVFLRPRRRRAIVAGAAAVAVGLAGIAYGMSVRATADRLPFIHDITTDTQDPPVFGEAVVAARGADANTLDYVGKRDAREDKLVSVLQTRDYPEIRPLVTERSPEVAYARAKDVARDLGWEIVEENPVEGRFDATATTFWYGFKDDVAVRVRPGAGGGSVVDVRSVSRVGASDLGANAERVGAFLAAFGD